MHRQYNAVNSSALFICLIIRIFQLILFSWNSVFLSQQISWNSISAYFFSEATGAICLLEAQLASAYLLFL